MVRVFSILFCFILFFASLAYAAANEPSWFEHVDFMQAALVAALAVISWFSVRTLITIDKNQKELFDRMHNLEKDFYTLRGEHNGRKENGNVC